MKNIYLLVFALIINYSGQSQQTIDFEPGSAWQYFVVQGTDSIWQVAVPSKGRFTGAYSGNYAMITDSANSMISGDTALIDVYIENGGCHNMYFSFWHKYYTDSLHSGGSVEMTFDNGLTWINPVYDTIYYDIWFNNFYGPRDTLSSGIPCFMGSSDEWKYSSISIGRCFLCQQNFSMGFRFVFNTDSVAVPLEGWMIDDVSLFVSPCKVKNPEKKKNIGFAFSQNDDNSLTITPDEDCILKITQMSGNTIYTSEAKKKEKAIIPAETMPHGFYIITAVFKNSTCSRKFRI